MTDKEKKSKIADILLEFNEEYQCNMPNRPMIPSLYASKIINSLQEEPVIEDILDVSRIDYRLQHKNIEDGIKYHAEEYSFNIESVLYNQLTGEQQKLWRKELERAVISGGYCGWELSKDKRYKENPVNEDLEEVSKQYALNNTPYEDCADEIQEAVKYGAQWQKQQVKKAMDLGEPPYLISVEQAYYRTLKLLEE